MEKKTKQSIVIGISALVLVTLTLLGLTYAYYRTRIIGNQSTDPSISVTTKKLELVYADGSGVLAPTGLLEPSDTQVGEKTFTVTNTGDETVSYSVYLENIQNPLTEGGLVYTLECTDNNGNDCTGVDAETDFPEGKTYKVVTNSIATQTTQTYTITLWYKDTGLDQSNDMGKTISAKVNIYDETAKPLASEILSNASTKANGTKYLVTPVTPVAEKQSSSNLTASDEGAKATKLTFLDVANSETLKDGYTDTLTGRVASSQYDKPRAFYSTTMPTGDCLATISTLKANQFTEMASACPQIQFNNEESIVTSDATSGSIEYDEITGKTPEFCNYVNTTENTYYMWDYSSDQIYTVNECIDDVPVVYAESIISKTEDDYGTSYYYRGAVEDNYVNFANMCWKIVRIQGDGSIKLILEDQYTTCESSDYTGNWAITSGNTYTPVTTYAGQYKLDNGVALQINRGIYGYTLENGIYKKNYSATSTTTAQTISDANDAFYNANLKNYVSSLKEENWCLSDNAYGQKTDTINSTPLTEEQIAANYTSKTRFYYDAYIRLHDRLSDGSVYNPSLKCNGNSVTSYVGTITADEAVFAGSKTSAEGSNLTYYLVNQFSKEAYGSFWTASPYDYYNGSDRIMAVQAAGQITSAAINSGLYSVRPSVVLNANTLISSGNGTQSNPYVVG